MNALDDLIKELTHRLCYDLKLSPKFTNQMIKEVLGCAHHEYNTRAELISLLKKH